MKLKNKGRISCDNVRKEPSKKLNQFEVHINRSKHQVLGRKLKSNRGLPGVSKYKALMKRKQTLLQEYKIRGKSNQFIDQRIGERNKDMTEDDRIMARFAAERMRVFNKKEMFNLSDTEVLTHKGQTLSEIERFEDIRSEDEDDEGRRSSGTLKDKFVENAHFGAGMLTKSKQDRESLIDELINESKKRKIERQHNKEETLKATEQLDKEWKTLGIIVTYTKDSGDVNNKKKDQYDIVMRQLKFEPHGQASQGLKTEEEIAKENKNQLEKLENQRLKQLREIKVNIYGFHKSANDLDDGFKNFAVDMTESDLAVSDSEDESGNEAQSGIGSGIESDSMDMNEDNESEAGKGEGNNEPEMNGLKSIKDKEESQGTNMLPENLESQEENEIMSEKNYEDTTEDESSDEDYAMDDFTDLMPSVRDGAAVITHDKKIAPESKCTDVNEEHVSSEAELHIELDLPFVLNIPDSYESFRKLLKKRTVQQQNVIFERLIKSNHPSLEAGNKKKMLTLAKYIIEHISKCDVEHCRRHGQQQCKRLGTGCPCSATSGPQGNGKSPQGLISWESLLIFVSQFNVLKEFNKEECLKMMVDSLSSELENLISDALPVHGIKLLTWYILVFLRPQGLDVLVPVSKPALSLACNLVTRTHHVTLGLLCCYLLLQDAKISSIIYPEAITYLHTCIKSTTNAKQKSSGKEQENTTLNVNVGNKETEDFRLCLNIENDLKEDTKILHCSVMLLSDFVRAYKKYPQSKIMFSQVQHSVSNIEADQYPPTLNKEIHELQTLLEVLSSANLPSLTKTAKKPRALPQYEPSFHTVMVWKSQRGLPTEQQEKEKLLQKYKHEMKGAMRELRRDRVFLANVKLKEKALSDEQRMKKMKEIFSSAAAQQGELRSLKRKK